MEECRTIILFADGNSLWTRPVRSELRRRGAQVQSLAGMDDDLLRPGAPSPDLIVVLDGLKDGDGGNLESRLRERWPQARVLLMASPHPAGRRAAERLPVIPLEREKVLEAILDALPGRLPEPPPRRKPAPLVLCVDDDRFYLDALARILGRHGYRTAAFLEPERALEALPEIHPDLAMVDIMMPGMDGLALAEELRELTHDRLPIVFLTARASDRDIVTGYEHGGTYYLTKPCEPAKVINIVDYLVGDLDPDERRLLEAQL